MPLSDDINGWINQASDMFGVSRTYLSTTALLESGGDPLANQNNNAAAKGLFQFIPSTAKQMGLSNPFNAQQSTFAAASLGATNLADLTNKLGRAPSDWELYLAHQQGAAGAANILNNPGQYASDGVTNFLGNINAKEFKQLTGVDVNNPLQPATNADFASYWKQKFQAVSGATNPAVSIPALGGGSSQTTAASAATKLSSELAGGKGGTAAVPANAKGGDTSTWQLWLEHQAVRGAVIVAGFIFLATGLGLFALGAVFSNPVAGAIATSYAGNRLARGTSGSAPPIDPPEPPKGGGGGATPLVPKGDGGGNFIRLNPPSKMAGLETPRATSSLSHEEFPGLPEVKNVTVFPTNEEQKKGASISNTPVGSMVEIDPATGEILRTVRGVGETPEGPITYLPAEKTAGEIYSDLGLDPKKMADDADKEQNPQRIALEAAKAAKPQSDEKAQEGVASVLTLGGTGDAKATQIPGSKRKKKAQGKVKEALAKMKPLEETVPAQISAPEEDEMLNRQSASQSAISVPEFGEFKVGKFAVLLDPKGRGRSDEPLKITEIWKDAKGVGIMVKGEKSGKGMFPASDLTTDIKPVRKAKQKGLLEKLGVLRDFTKPRR